MVVLLLEGSSFVTRTDCAVLLRSILGDYKLPLRNVVLHAFKIVLDILIKSLLQSLLIHLLNPPVGRSIDAFNLGADLSLSFV